MAKHEHVDRKLAAILAADVVGYSRLMGADEVGTLRALKAVRKDHVDPAIAAYGGRIVKTTGDGLLVDFPSVVDAVACAVTFQRKTIERNKDISEEKRIVFRVGINIGGLPTDADLDTAGTTRTLAYDRAWWLTRFVADRYGAATLRRLYERACGPGHPDVETAVSETLGADLGEVLADWRRWLTG